MVSDWSADKQAFDMPWGKLMMWIFLLSDTFIFSVFPHRLYECTDVGDGPLAQPSEVFALEDCGTHLPLVLIAIMTFILITSSGTMAMAVNFAYSGDKRKTVILMAMTALLGASFVGMQAFEWTKLIVEKACGPGATRWGAHSLARRSS